MQDYKINIKLKSSIITPFHSDTLWGHICWALRYTRSEQELLNFLECYDSGEPPLVISNAFPKGCLPFPVLEPIEKTKQRELINTFWNESDFIAAVSAFKKLSTIKYISKELFKHISKGTISRYSLLEAILANPKKFPVISAELPSVTYHAKINRLSGTAIDGGLFTAPEIFYFSNELEAYCKIGHGFSEEKLKQCMEFINIDGFGRKKSTGKGAVYCTIERRTDDVTDDTNAFMSLSNYVPCQDDPQKGFYKLITKYGKLGGHFASSSIIPGKNPTPFKYPIVMFESGSVFKVDKKKEHYGRIVKGVHPAKKINIVHYGMAYPMPLKIEGLND